MASYGSLGSLLASADKPSGHHDFSEARQGNANSPEHRNGYTSTDVDMKEAEIQSEDFGKSGTVSSSLKKHRKRKRENTATKTEANTLEDDSKNTTKKKKKQRSTTTKGIKAGRLDVSKSMASTSHGRSSKKPLSIQSTSSLWKFSVANAGRFINHQPIFVNKDKHIVLSISSELRVYSVSTSALVKSISLSSFGCESASIVAYTASSINDRIIYISASDNSLLKVDWRTGKCLGQRQQSSQLSCLSSFSYDGQGVPQDILIHVEQSQTGSTVIARRMSQDSEHWEDGKSIHNCKDIIQLLECDRFGIIVACTENRLMVGWPSLDAKDSPLYTWREAHMAEKIRCVDFKSEQRAIGSKKSQQLPPKPIVNIAVGNGQGAIIRFDDFLAISNSHSDTNQSSVLDGRKMHWHRGVVLSTRWSADGNYIISGGNERTLVIWQLDTGRRQYLPHLPSSVESITISSDGTLYALRLGDNSIVVISTSDLEPKACIMGIQANSWAAPGKHLAVSNSSSRREGTDPGSHLLLRLPMVIDPIRPLQMLLAVPSLQTTDEFGQGSPYLQTFDYQSGHSLGRQALSRTNATVKQIGGDLNSISEPSVYLMKTSFDGNWLATVDVWNPPGDNSEESSNDLPLSSSAHREIYLKFWRRDDKSQEWLLVARVDAPHHTWDSDFEAGLVLDIAVNPLRAEFATIGEDGVVKIWKPKVRMRDGLLIKAVKSDEEGLWSWSCRQMIILNQPTDIEEDYNAPSSACLAYSEDASTVAASCQHGGSREPCLVHFIQTFNGSIRLSRTGLVNGLPISLGFINRYLVIVSEDIIVWDVVDDCLQYGFKLPRSSISTMYRLASTHLAVDTIGSTFAIALPVLQSKRSRSKSGHPPANIAVFGLDNPAPQFYVESPYPVTALRYNPSKRGYLAVDAAAEVRLITPSTSANAIMPDVSDAIALVEDEEMEPVLALQDIYTGLGSPKLTETIEEDTLDSEQAKREEMSIDNDDDSGEDDAPVVSKEQLAEIFNAGSTFSLAPVDNLFAQVARLYIGSAKA